MANERKTETIVRNILAQRGYLQAGLGITVEEQISENPKIKKLLAAASKAGGGAGYPEFIITSEHYPDLLIVIECKAETSRHISPNLDQYASYACDGALLYAAHLSKQYDVIAIGVSGQNEDEVRKDFFVHLRGKSKAVQLPVSDILSIDDFYKAYVQTPEKFNQDYDALLAYTQDLNKTLHKLKVKESQRSLLISSMLISLKNAAFKAGYKHHQNAKQITKALLQTVLDELTNAGVSAARLDNLKNAYSFITTEPRRVCRRLITISYAAMSSASRAA